MLLIPWLTEEFTSPLAPDVLLQRLQANVAPASTVYSLFNRQIQSSALFTGTVAADSFKLHRVIGYRNSILPQIHGWVVADAHTTGSRLRLRHRLHPVPLAFGALFVANLMVQIILPLAWDWVQKPELNPLYLAPLGMLAFIGAVYNIPFRLEVAQSRPLLVRLLDLQEAVAK